MIYKSCDYFIDGEGKLFKSNRAHPRMHTEKKNSMKMNKDGKFNFQIFNRIIYLLEKYHKNTTSVNRWSPSHQVK